MEASNAYPDPPPPPSTSIQGIEPFLFLDIETVPQAWTLADDVELDIAQMQATWERLLVLPGEAPPMFDEYVAIQHARAQAPLAKTGCAPALHWTTCHIVALNLASDVKDAAPKKGVLTLKSMNGLDAVTPTNAAQTRAAEALLVTEGIRSIRDSLARRRCIVTFNGKGFDLPILRCRGMALNLPKGGFRDYRGDRLTWSKLFYPWSDWPHCDLRIALTGNKFERGGLEWTANALGVQASSEGASVFEYARSGQWKAIESYGLRECDTGIGLWGRYNNSP